MKRLHKDILVTAAGSIALLGILLGLISLMDGCNKPNPCQAVRTLGFTNCRVTHESAWLSNCNRGDSDEFSARATNVAGQNVSLVVCCGWNGACSVRVPSN